MDVQTLASIAMMLATGIAIVTFLGRKTDHARAEAKTENAATQEELARRIDGVGHHLGERIDRVESDVAEVRADVRMLADRLFNVVLAPSTRVLPAAQGE